MLHFIKSTLLPVLFLYMHNYEKQKPTETKKTSSAQYGSLNYFARDEDTFQM